MLLTPLWRTRLFALGGAILAVIFGAQIAQESLFWPLLSAGVLVAFIATRSRALPFGTLFLGAVLFGYIVGNRGFAQISLSGSFPLLPAEVAIAGVGVALVIRSALRRELPWQRDLLNHALLAWMLVGTIRLLFDVRAFGFGAIRDYAFVYYAAFFFLTQALAREKAAADFLLRCLVVGCAVLLVVHPLFEQFPGFFIGTLTLRGIPIIFFKDDLAGNFMSLGALLFFALYERRRKLPFLGLSLASAALMLTTNSRSSLVGLLVGAALLALGRRWRFAASLGVSGVVAPVVIVVASEVRNRPWQQTMLGTMYERVASIVDPAGMRTYVTEDTVSKGDNNVFRMVWWQAAVTETVENHPWVGLGFGYDLADRFVREYFPENDDFTARSPHNVLITVFARMGAIGFLFFAALLIVIGSRTWRALRHPPPDDPIPATLWTGVWVIFACACFGVVLEGPMGAVVFWVLLGLASADNLRGSDAEAEAESPPERLPITAEENQVSPA